MVDAPERDRMIISSTADPAERPPAVGLMALIAVRNEMQHLPELIANLARQVDGIVALDDGSTDGSVEFLESRSEVIELLRVPPQRPRWDEVGNHWALVSASLRNGADWLISVDADHRLERDFRRRFELVVERGSRHGFTAYAVPVRELWGSPRTFRVDGIWGQKVRARLFQATEESQFDARPLHATKAPLQAAPGGRFPLADLEIYHLRMILPEDRWARRRRYEKLDPEERYQPGIGYAYLTDETGLRLQEIPPDRDYLE
jgi:glycosyltransferase involved in cell wall biosynthesis